MGCEPVAWPERLALTARLGIFVLAGVLALGALFGAKDAGPLNLGKVFATGRNSAAPGYLSLTVRPGSANKFYIVDTTRQVICVYNLSSSDELRLVSARRFDHDRSIMDATIPAPKPLEKINTGVTYAEAEAYQKACEKLIETEKKRLGP